MNKKAQAFVQDMIIALVLMSMVLLIYFGFYTNQDISGESKQQNLISEAKTITDYLTTEGYPFGWNQSTVVRIGITSQNNVLDKNKLEMFSNMTRDEYDKTRSLLKTKYDYIVFFQDYGGNILNISGQNFMGKAGVNSTNYDSQDPARMAKISRFVVLKEGDTNITARIIEMTTYVWTKEK